MGYATEAAEPMPGLPRQPRVPVWVTDDRWEVWHVWQPEDVMDVTGRARTACGCEWYWSATATTSYQIMADAGCDLCRSALVGFPQKRGPGRPPRLPQGPLPPKAPPGRPGRPPKPVIEPEPLAGMADVAKTRTQILADLGAKVSTYERDGKLITRAHPTRKQAEAADMADLDFTFEVGRRLPAWECMECGTVLAAGDRYCSTWCSKENRERERQERFERQGLVMARRQFHDMLFRTPRRDTIRSWTPPAANLRRPRVSP